MAQYNINSATASDLTNAVKDYEVTPMQTDGVSNQDETWWVNPNWNWQWGYFNTNADLKSAILMKSIWHVGRGHMADSGTEAILDNIKGWGKDCFDDIIFNMDVIMRVGGDSFAETIRDSESGQLINLKPLDPSSIIIVLNKQGIIIRYEQIAKVPGSSVVKKFQPKEILHLSHNRLADQIHGISDIDAL